MKTIIFIFFNVFFANVFANSPIIKIYMDRIEINGNSFYSKDIIKINMIKCALNGEKYVTKKIKDNHYKHTFKKSKLVLYSAKKDKGLQLLHFSFFDKKNQFKGKIYILGELFTTENPLCFDSEVNGEMCSYPSEDESLLNVFRSNETGVIKFIEVKFRLFI